MASPTPEEIKKFLQGQADAWNSKDREKFFELYHAMAPKSFTMEYVGQPPKEAWPTLEHMWANEHEKVRVEEIAIMVNGTDAACYVHNHVIGTDKIVKTIEVYSFGEGTVAVRYFIGH